MTAVIPQKYYAGIGSRRTPKDVLLQMEQLAVWMANVGYVLRSGGADGADWAFEHGCADAGGEMEIYLPWKGFNHNTSSLYTQHPDTYKIAAELHLAWNYLSAPARTLMARNVHQILGSDLQTPVEFVVCYTPDGCTSIERYTSKTGGTGLAIALASVNNIPVFNLRNTNAIHQLVDFVSSRDA